ncbi:AraC family transcriptional regulator [Mucilaginibacter sp.]|jgi:YesN/AraC family two-component response regulator|uniref:AraC family transcriptional regulator n=1 Tax=Mucilaginibacter sp. TaxID=1882438 RepID=UPI002608B8EF|nr:AraC family transcriptional regulator [Mucilaginibacter sp.]MDB4919597.1 btr 8 [Mucilaginibacter sp.]
MDALSTLIEATKIESVVYNKLVNRAPWGIEAAEDNNSQYWRLISGSCVIGLPDGEIINMREGDLVFIPHGSAHWIADKATSIRVPAAEYTKARMAGIPIFWGDGEEAIIIGGHFHFGERNHLLLKDLPRIIRITEFATDHQLMLDQTAQLILAELSKEKPGSRIMLKALAEILFINIIRAYLEQAVHQTGFFSALNDAPISKALKLIQDAPGKEWTLKSIAENVGLSRSVFFNRFKKLVGATPSTYLTDWRITHAKEILLTSNNNINEIAEKVGYQSEAAFNRIFKSKTGYTPAAFRRNQSYR